jgi:hypothetical protein
MAIPTSRRQASTAQRLAEERCAKLGCFNLTLRLSDVFRGPIRSHRAAETLSPSFLYLATTSTFVPAFFMLG